MRIGAYQFAVTGNIESNYAHIKAGIEKAFQSGVRLLLFPECAVTGYRLIALHPRRKWISIKSCMSIIRFRRFRNNSKCTSSREP